MHRVRMLLAGAAAAGLTAVVALAAAGTTGAVAAGSPCGHVARAPSWRHVVVIAFENHSYSEILGKSAPPSYMKTLAAECGSAVDYTAVHFPRSLPNYLGATSGKITTTSDCLPSADCSSGSGNIFSQVGGLHWRTFAESMPAPCYRQDTSLYVPRHAPAVYYTRIPRAVCVRDMVTLPSHPLKLKRAFTWIAPNLQHDMHDGSPAQASSWLQTFLGGPNGILHRRPYTNGHTAIFIWFDSSGASGSAGTPLPFIVVSPSTPAKVARRPLNHYSSLRAWEAMLGLPCRNAACDANGMRLPFHL
jgi:phosphatidylinositol-3-phosphatase